MYNLVKQCKRFFLILTNLIFTYRCYSCGLYLPYYVHECICDDCFNKHFKPIHICNCCYQIIDAVDMHINCYNVKKSYVANKIICSSLYTSFVKRIIRDLKYHKQEQVSCVLAHFIFYALIYYEEILKNIDVIVPVPIYIRKKTKNHSFFISQSLQTMINKLRLNVQLSTDLIKLKDNISQTKLSRLERKKNVQGVYDFITISNIKDKSVLLIDDVLTTGATTMECAKVLKSTGQAKSVFVFTVAYQLMSI